MHLVGSPKASHFWKLKPYYLMDYQFVEYLREHYYLFCNDLEETNLRVTWDAFKAYISGMIQGSTVRAFHSHLRLK